MSGGDTNIQGAVVAGNSVQADIGGKLTIQSLQDTSTYTESSKNAGASITISPAGVPTGGSISAGKTNTHSNYQNVAEQSGQGTAALRSTCKAAPP